MLDDLEELLGFLAAAEEYRAVLFRIEIQALPRVIIRRWMMASDDVEALIGHLR